MNNHANCSQEREDYLHSPIKVQIINNFYNEKTILDAAFFEDPESKTLKPYEQSLRLPLSQAESLMEIVVPIASIKSMVFILRYDNGDDCSNVLNWRKLRRDKTIIAARKIKFKHPTKRSMRIEIIQHAIQFEFIQSLPIIIIPHKRKLEVGFATFQIGEKKVSKEHKIKRLKENDHKYEQEQE